MSIEQQDLKQSDAKKPGLKHGQTFDVNELFSGLRDLKEGEPALPSVFAGFDGAAEISSGKIRQNLDELAKKFFDTKEQTNLTGYLDQFENRVKAENLSESDKTHVYSQLSRILKDAGQGNQLFSAAEVRSKVLDIARQAAMPGLVSQGKSTTTCTAGSLEGVLYQVEPGVVAEMDADMIINDQYVTNDGTIIKPPAKNLKPSKYDKVGEEYSRSGASQIAQVTLLNIYWNRQDSINAKDGNASKGQKGQIFFEEGYPSAFIGDMHARLINRATGKPFTEQKAVYDPIGPEVIPTPLVDRPIDNPLMSIGQIRDIYNQLRGNKGKLTLIGHSEEPGVNTPKTPEEFKKLMGDAAAGKDGLSIPIIMGVHAALGLLRSDQSVFSRNKPKDLQSSETPSTSHIHHALWIYHYDPKTELASVENLWGLSVDHTGKEGSKPKMSVEQLYEIYKKDEKENELELKDDNWTPAKHIAVQREFVDELNKDDDVDPYFRLCETITLARYLDHWNRKDEIPKLVPKLVNDLDKCADRLDFQKQSQLLSLTQDKRVSEKIFAKLDRELENKFEKGQYDFEQADKLISLHREQNDNEGAIRILDKISALKTTDIAKIVFLKTNGRDKQALELTKAVIESLREKEKLNGYSKSILEDKRKVADMLIESGDQITGKKLADELVASAHEIKNKNKDGRSLCLSTLFLVQDLYENLGDFENLYKVTKEALEMDDYGAMEFSHAGDKFAKYRQLDKAVIFYEKAYQMVEKQNNKGERGLREYRWIAGRLIKVYKDLNRAEEAAKIEKATGLN